MKNRISLTLATAVTLALALTASLICCVKPSSTSSLSQAERKAIIDSACKALRDAHRKGDEIPEESWSQAIAKLHPIRVLNDRINIFIVLKEDANTEEGLYVSNPISSYAPGVDKRFVRFEKLTQPEDKDFGALYDCKMLKEKQDGNADGSQPGK